MKKLLVLGALLFSVVEICPAATCTSGTLTSYLALGSTGCTIGADTLSNFKTLTGTLGSPISTGSITIGTSGGTFSPLVTFGTSQTAAAGVTLESFFTYQISGPSFLSTTLSLSGSSETVDGGVTDIVNFCSGGVFGSNGVTGCTGSTGSLLTLDGIQNSDKSSFPPSLFVNVTDDFTLSGGVAGTATGGTFTNGFSSVPEPGSILFAGLGLALAAGAGIRNKRFKQLNLKKEQ